MFRPGILLARLRGLALIAVVTAGAAQATVIFTPNSWQLDVYGTSTGLDQTGSPDTITLSDTSNTFLDPRTQIGVDTLCGAQTCGATGQTVMGGFLATANLSTFSIGVAVDGTGAANQDVHEFATSSLQINIPLIGTIAPGNQAEGSVTMSVHGGGVGDPAFEAQRGVGPSLSIGANMTTCTYDTTVHDVLGSDCFAPSASASWTSEPDLCGGAPGCYGLSAFPGTLTSDFLVYSDYTILHLDIDLGVQAYVDASADLSHTASFIITPPPGFTVDYSAFTAGNTSAVPEPRNYAVLLAGILLLLLIARGRLRSRTIARG